MRHMKLKTVEEFSRGFINPKFLPDGNDGYYLRKKQNPKTSYRNLTQDEIKILVQNGNHCNNWETFLVEEPFTPKLIKNSHFAGLIRIAKLEEKYLQYHDYIVPVGITNSRITDCDILENCAIHDCSYIANYIIGNRVILSRIDELCTTDHAKFGEGIVKEGEEQKVQISIEVLNESGGRDVLPFVNLIPADAYIWARYRENEPLMLALKKITEDSVDKKRGYYGTIGDECCIKSCRIIKDVRFGNSVYAKGANKLKNITVRSTFDEPTQIGEGVELINGIVGLGSRVFYGAKAVRFIIGTNCELKYGARLIHSILGDNSTISCCEVLNALIFPFHEQHHNNSFLIAAMIQGQSNMAAGATIGSNHNTRGPDGEIIAGRGFWPGLCTTLKHNSKFAPFVIISKGNYNYELNIKLPFSLVINNESDKELQIMPAYYWMHNMYSLERNNKKFAKRDKRVTKLQIIETDYLAPDTVASIIEGMKIVGKACELAWASEKKERLTIKQILENHFEQTKNILVYCNDEGFERSSRRIKILKPFDSWKAYYEMLIWYGVKTLCNFFEATGKTITDITCDIENAFNWENIGGQLMHQSDIQKLTTNIIEEKLSSWEAIHNEYSEIQKKYLQRNAETAYAALLFASGESTISKELWKNLVQKAIEICDYIAEQVYATKNKDYVDKFRSITYRNKGEQEAVLSTIDKNEVVQGAKDEAETRKAFLKKFL